MLKTMVPELVAAFRERAEELAESLQETELNPLGFMSAIAGVRSLVEATGRQALESVISQYEELEDVVNHESGRLRFKQISQKRWLTPYGGIDVPRRLFQADAGGPSYVPTDVRTGMVDRYLTPDVEEWVSIGSAMMSPAETHLFLGKIMTPAPSTTAIQRAVRDVGGFAESSDASVEERMQAVAPLSSEGDVLVASWDGVHVPIRGDGSRAGDGPPAREGGHRKVNWREAGAGSISIYGAPADGEDEPQRLDARYFGRMPEKGMTTLVCQMESMVRSERRRREFRDVVVLCDGSESIWTAASAVSAYDDATWILDYYHALTHLSKAAKAIFGSDEAASERWHKKYRRKLRDDPGGCLAALRSMDYYKVRIRGHPARQRALKNARGYFLKNQSLMDYAGFRARGLPIGSGPVEATCKSLVAHRMKRSGMRWSIAGGQEVLNLRRHFLARRWDVLWACYAENRHRSAA